MAIDLRRTLPRITTNTLKDYARQSTLFEVGLKIFYKLENIDVQLDFVDAELFFSPWEIDQMVQEMANFTS